MPPKYIRKLTTKTNIIIITIIFFVAVFFLMLITVITTPRQTSSPPSYFNIHIPTGAPAFSAPNGAAIIPVNTSSSSCNNPCDTQPPHNPLSGISVIANSPTPSIPIYTATPPSTAAPVPVSVCTQPVSNYSQVGILSRGEKVLPLYGRKLERDRWQYYSSTDSYNSMKVPIYIGGKDAMNEYGYSELTDGDFVMVTGNEYVVTKYQNTYLQYLPPAAAAAPLRQQ